MTLSSLAVKVAVANVCAAFQVRADSVPPVTVMPAPLARLATVEAPTASLKLNVTSELLSGSLSEASTMSTATVGLRVSIGTVSGPPAEPRFPATSV